ncbi:beta-ketoacyl synthase N-terminal-like domain-containing protein [Shigella flexneri]
MKRAVITGLGIVSSIGNNQQENPGISGEGRSGITFSQELKDSGMRSHVSGNVKLDTTGLIDRKVVRFMSDASIYAFLSMEQAIADAGLSPEAYQNNPRVGLIAGSSSGSPRFQVFGADAMRGPRGLKAVGRMWSPKRWHPAFLPASPPRLKFMALTTPSAPRVRLPHTVSVTQ